jgi:RNA polymerase sigma factor (sigma-70 family)
MSSIDRGTVSQQLDRLFSEGTLAGLGDGELLERFLTRRDEAAFAALVELHGPMVLGLCRRFLRDPRDIEDAFQATFLVLVRNASGIRDRNVLSTWLYGVALRVATRARANLLRRRGREQAIGDAEFTAKPESHDLLGLGPVLDQELSRLPAKYRAPLVLCYLRGQTHDQAATALQCPVGTVRSRMARGRDLLKRRLTRRGCAPGAALFGAGLDVPCHLLTEVVPAQLVATTVEGALAIGSSHTIQAGAVTASVLALTQGVVTSMKFAQLKWIGLALLATGLSAGGAVVVGAVAAQNSATTGAPAVSAGPVQENPTKSVSTATSTTGSSNTTEERLRALEEQIDRIYRVTGILGETGSPGIGPNTPTLDRLETKLQFLLSRHERPRPRGATTEAMRQTISPDAGTIPVEATAGSATSTTTPKVGVDRTTWARSTREIAPPASTDGSSARIRELEIQLRLATTASMRANQLRQQHAISDQELEEARGKVALTIATLQGMADDFTDDLEQATLVVKQKKAELDEAIAQQDGAKLSRTDTKRLHDTKVGGQSVVSDNEFQKVDAEFRSAEAHVRVKAVELEGAGLLARKVERWRSRIQRILESAGVKPAG